MVFFLFFVFRMTVARVFFFSFSGEGRGVRFLSCFFSFSRWREKDP